MTPCTALSAASGKSTQKGINFTSTGSPGVMTAIGIGIAIAKQRGYQGRCQVTAALFSEDNSTSRNSRLQGEAEGIPWNEHGGAA